MHESIEPVFSKKYKKSPRNSFPVNVWFDGECKSSRNRVNQFAKLNDLSNAAVKDEYRCLMREYKGLITRKKREYQRSNREKLSVIFGRDQTECWKVWNKLKRTKLSVSNAPSLNDFHDYFTQQAKPPSCPYFDQNFIESLPDPMAVSNHQLGSIQNEICDSPITEDEVSYHIRKLNNNKAAGIDGIQAEFYKYAADKLVTPFCVLFNHIFNAGDYPSQWSEGLIIALHKKGDVSIPDNYRKITINVVMGKVFDSILNARLYFKNESHKIDDPFQFGFTPTRRTTDCVFILDTLLFHQQYHKKPLYLCFVDFTKAFDYVDRTALYHKLKEQNIGSKMLKVIISMFNKARARVLQHGETREPIDSTLGVLQGGILSPKFFNEFLSDLPEYLDKEDGLSVNSTYFTHLLYADDIVLISESHIGLQNLLNSLKQFCSRWHLIVNTTKTKVLIHGSKTAPSFSFNDQRIETVESYKYLGHVIGNKKNMHANMSEHVATQARKAIFALNGDTKASLGYIPPKLALKMFDTYILPILEYHSELWLRNNPVTDLENIQLRYLKNLLSVRTQTPTLAVYAETGRYPLYVRQRLSCIKYWARLEHLDKSDILYKCLMIQKELHSARQTNWYSKVEHILSNYDIAVDDCMSCNQVISRAKLVIYTHEQEKIMTGISDSAMHPKLRTYKLFKSDFRLEPYLDLNLNKRIYTKIARFRCSSHSLKIETGRHERPIVPVEHRICDKCTSNEVEDELHCLITCNSHHRARSTLFLTVSNFIPDLASLSNPEIFTTVLKCKEPEVLKALGKFLDSVM